MKGGGGKEGAEGPVEIAVLVSAGSTRTGIRGMHGGMLKVAVSAPPERGKANEELERILAKWLGVPARTVRVVAGASSRRKRVRVESADPERIAALVHAR